MKQLITASVLLLLFIIPTTKAQSQDTITIKLFVSISSQLLEVATGKVVEGQEYIIPAKTLSPPFSSYQYYYDAIVGSKFYIEEGGLDHNVLINILLEFPPQIPWIINGKRIWFLATFEVDGVVGQDFYFQNNKSAVFEIPRTQTFDQMIQQLGFTPGTPWAFAYFKPGVGFVNLNVSTINQPDKVICKLRHFSEVAGSTQSELSVDELIDGVIPKEFELKQNYPNPFNPITTIEYSISQKSHVKLVVYNLIGKEIATLVDGIKEIGAYRYNFNAGNLPSGVYIYKLKTNEKILTKKMMLVK